MEEAFKFRPSTGHQKVFGRNHALTIEATTTRPARGSWPTLQFEFAQALESGAAPNYDWPNKLSIQLKPDHLPLYAAVLLGDLPSVEFNHYGDSRNKTFRAQSEAGRVAIKGLAPGRGHAIPAPPERVFWLIAQVLQQLRAANEAIDSITARAMIRRTAELYRQQTDTE